MTHCLSWGGTCNLCYDVLQWESFWLGDCGEYGRCHDLPILPYKIACYLFEFDSFFICQPPSACNSWEQKPSQHPWTHERATGFAYNPFLCIFCVLCIFVYTFTHLGIHLHRLYTYWCTPLQPDTGFAYKSFYIHILWFYVYLNIHLHILHILHTIT